MGILDKLKKKKNYDNNATKKIIVKNNELEEVNNYVLSDIKKEEIKENYSYSFNEMAKYCPHVVAILTGIKSVSFKRSKSKEKLYKITNLGKNDKLKALKNGEEVWGAIRKSDGTSTMAKLKEVKQQSCVTIDPTMLMVSAALCSVEAELDEIKKLNIKIVNFLEDDKESEIEADLEILNKTIIDFRFNFNDERFLINNHKQVMDIKRRAKSNLVFYKRQIANEIKKNKIITTKNGMNSILLDIERIFKYYRLSSYIYAYSTLMEVLILGNFNSEFLNSKLNELSELNTEYEKIYEIAFDYVESNANKVIEGNVLNSIGSAGKAIGNFVEKTNVKRVDTWINDASNNIKQTGKDMKQKFIKEFENLSDSNSERFSNQINQIDCIYNKTKEIYFDEDRIYLETGE